MAWLDMTASLRKKTEIVENVFAKFRLHGRELLFDLLESSLCTSLFVFPEHSFKNLRKFLVRRHVRVCQPQDGSDLSS